MRITCTWEDGMKFEASNERLHLAMDAKKPVGTESAMTPKELVLAGVCGCTAMDVVGLLKKSKAPIDQFHIEADATTSEKSHPKVFTQINLKFVMKANIEPQLLIDAVTLSQTKFCGVSAMLAKAAPIHYRIILNDSEIGSGNAQFPN